MTAPAIPRIAPVLPVVFPESHDAHYSHYRHDAKKGMIKWVTLRLAEVAADFDEMGAWILVHGLAREELGRPLGDNEAELLTATVRDVFTVLEAQRVHRLRI